MKLFNVKVCGDCDELVALTADACPSCTCTKFVNLSTLLGIVDRKEVNLVRTIENAEGKPD